MVTDGELTRVAVHGEVLHVVKKDVAEEVEPFLFDGFVMLDLEGIRQQSVRKPWIFDVSVTRHQTKLLLPLKNRYPQRAENVSLNHRGGANPSINRGEIFTPIENGAVIDGLPQLQGSDGLRLIRLLIFWFLGSLWFFMN